jgi:hypothetical protein
MPSTAPPAHVIPGTPIPVELIAKQIPGHHVTRASNFIRRLALVFLDDGRLTVLWRIMNEGGKMSVNPSQQKAARVAGLTLVLAIVIIVVTNYAVSFRFIVPGDAAETARNIMEHQTLFRLNMVGDIVYMFDVVILLSALYVVLKPVSHTLSLIAACTRLIYAVIWAAVVVGIYNTIRLVEKASSLSVFTDGQLQALASLQHTTNYDCYYIALPFWGLASVVISFLFLKSRYIPRLLAWFGLFSSVWCVFCGFAFLIDPGFGDAVHPGWFDMPLVVFEVILGFWLLIKGLGAPKGTREES